ncbi:hypothetical protein A3K48_05340 [candidate division WOR-1 bacterium RIFOXYA12_FULL_52_29]|uniref:Prepilin-type N-terminal cleavage/methylation domain-containing protein n=1 Tax=candidate division WOR-1 bacterium RIFOXYC12_FULL_54_18 TaxID=1802584 RepID=A0A1F4T6P0_UNCSA|nr:MAG: hypothetical protein A3K44_05340 [candidate division WOR-1 bacterium RIFOXYA2_FULL_51_19]OGC17968.1 MAG: hypothetical protein A3K48_05340 [candidate division WOR-1 bacterium RIFOXYA12_FULL_52_29]OGC26825.1 MAG: hypothetical protein A3K32_05335 [candidate division WOR-1 bacterium RIFOXYB2_FULL_45_9]OGC28385.1 MAG: hypothetical protein A3K49_05340 [candidate division WOR-1 bacterium RIFOXYC12_FULL_54_18]OGC31159.1 MAG: hypothetical protein A2346_07280 [candidate division WOR-1 bacterium R
MNKGFTLVEVLVAAALLFLFSQASLAIFKQARMLSAQERPIARAVQAAQKTLAEIEIGEPGGDLRVVPYSAGLVKIELAIECGPGRSPFVFSTIRKSK